jgi:hypothetical protein
MLPSPRTNRTPRFEWTKREIPSVEPENKHAYLRY